MSFRRRHQIAGLAVAAGVLLGCGMWAMAAELPPSKPAEYSNPFEEVDRPPELADPKNETKTESLKSQGLPPGSSMRGLPAPILPPPPRAVVVPNRLQESSDRRKDWVFREPESLFEDPQKQELLGVDGDKKEHENLSPMERFYLKFVSPSPTAKKEETAPDRMATPEKDALLPQGLRASEAFLQEVTQQARQSSLSGARLEGLEGLDLSGGATALVPELTPAQRFRQDAFRQLLQESFIIPGNIAGNAPQSGLNATAMTDRPRLDPYLPETDSKLSSSSLLRAPETQLGVVPPLPSLIDVNTRALTPQTPSLMTPSMMQQSPLVKPPTQVNAGPPRPTFSAPRRAF